MTIRHVQIFVKVAECGKMNEAAKDLFISQSSVSQAIAEIENEYQVRLFERLGRKLYLTSVGKDFLNYAKRFLTLHESMLHFLEEAGEIREMRIGATITVGTCVIMDILREVQEKYPDCKAQVYVANTQILEEKLVNNELDIALVEGKIVHPVLSANHAILDQLVLICGRGSLLWGKEAVTLRELENENFIMREQGSGTRAQLEEALLAEHISFHIKWTAYNTETIKNAVMGNEGVSVISRRLVQEEVERGQIWCCNLRNFQDSRNFDVVYHKDKLITPVLHAFIEACHSVGRRETALQGPLTVPAGREEGK